jgi:hypothetical protein
MEEAPTLHSGRDRNRADRLSIAPKGFYLGGGPGRLQHRPADPDDLRGNISRLV